MVGRGASPWGSARMNSSVFIGAAQHVFRQIAGRFLKHHLFVAKTTHGTLHAKRAGDGGLKVLTVKSLVLARAISINTSPFYTLFLPKREGDR